MLKIPHVLVAIGLEIVGSWKSQLPGVAWEIEAVAPIKCAGGAKVVRKSSLSLRSLEIIFDFVFVALLLDIHWFEAIVFQELVLDVGVHELPRILVIAFGLLCQVFVECAELRIHFLIF